LEIPIPRPHGTNIIEQLQIVEFMRKRSPGAIVIECMAVQPEFQWVCENHMVKATVGVITNSRLDHIREMGPSIQNVTRSLCNTLPKNGITFTAEKINFALMQKEAKRSNTKLLQVREEAIDSEDLRGFSYVEHRENVALALAVCQHLGVNKETALKGMHSVHPDPGALKIFKVKLGLKEVHFVYAMAANDPDSTLSIWKINLEALYQDREYLSVYLHTRPDRFDRSVQLLEMCKTYIHYDHLILTGEKIEQVVGAANRLKMVDNRLIVLKRKMPEEVQEVLLNLAPAQGLSVIFGIGNVGGGGLAVAKLFQKKSAMQTKVKENSID
jgi:poly-gamma-glutamate synthase PgsB/CapB